MGFSKSSKQEVNNLAVQYISATGEQQIKIFEQILKEFKKAYKSDMLRFSNQTSEMDYPEVVGMYEDVMMDILFNRYNGTFDFVNYLSRSLSNKKANIIRDLQKQRKDFKETFGTIQMIEGKQKGTNDKEFQYEIPSTDVPTQEVVMMKLDERNKTNEDKKVLLDDLLSKTDEETRLIIQSFIKNKFNYTATAKDMGIKHHETVKRKIKRLAKHFDQARFGDVADYLQPLR